ncbi:hypothetical protein RB595_000320 [Gaeumannomyces hyphopodioides]
MYIPVGTVPSSLDQLVGDLERRQARGDAASVKSVSTNNSGAGSVQSNNTNSTGGRGRGATPAVPTPRVPVGQQPRSIDDLMSDLETRQIRGDAASVASASSNGAQSVQSNNTSSTRGGGRAKPTPAPRVPVGQQPRSIDELVADLETRQIRGDAASVASASTDGAGSVQSANTNSTSGRAQPAPAPRVPVGREPRSIDDLVSDLETRQVRGGAGSVSSVSTDGGRSVQSTNTNSTGGARRPARPAPIPVGPQPRSIDELLSDLETRQVRGGAGSVSSVSTNGRSVQSADTNSTTGARQPAPPARIPIGAQPRSVDELLSDLERRQVRGGGAASVASVSTNGQSVQSNNTNSTRGARQPTPPARIPIGAQPRSLAELVGDLERRQVAGGDAASVSSVSSKNAKSVKSVKSTKQSSGTAPAPTTSSALPQPPAAEPTSAPAITTTPAANPASSPAPPASSPPVSNVSPVLNPAAPLSSTAAPVVASPSPTTLLTRVSSSPGGGTALPDMGLSSSTTPAGPVATVLPPASELPSSSPPGGSANSEMGPQGGAPMPTGMMVGVIFGSVLGFAVVAAFLFVCCVRRRRAKAERESQLAMAAAAAQYPDEKGKRPVTDWEDRLYGSANRSTGGGFSDRAKSIFVVPWKFISGNRGGQQPPPEFPQLPLPPKLGADAGPASTRYSKRSTGLTTLDETQFKTYNNLVGRSNPKKPVAFDNPYFQKDEWK